MSDRELLPLLKTDIEIGRRLLYPVYDRNHVLLLKEGQVVQSERQLETLLAIGLFRESHWKPSRTRSQAEPEEAPPEPAGKGPESVPFEKIRFSLDDILQLQPLDNTQVPYYVHLIGVAPRQSLIVSAPTLNGSLVLVRDGQPFKVRAFLGKSIYLFDTHVIRPCLTPYPYVHLSCPARAQVLQVRHANRVKVSLIASVGPRDRPDAEKQACVVHDLSLGGGMLQSQKPLGRVDDAITLTLKLQVVGQDFYLSLPARIRNRRQAEAPDPGVQYGVQFEELDTQSKLVLQNFIYQQLQIEA